VSFPIDRSFIRTPSSMIAVMTRERGPWRAESTFSGSARSAGSRAEKVVVVVSGWVVIQVAFQESSQVAGLVLHEKEFSTDVRMVTRVFDCSRKTGQFIVS